MPSTRKPGRDTLVYFWFALILYALGVVFQLLGLFLAARQLIGLNVLGMTTPHLVALGCYVGASIFVVVLLHKIIAMLIYLVHHQRQPDRRSARPTTQRPRIDGP